MAPTEGKTAARSAVESMLAEHGDVVRESVAFMVRELIEAEVSQLVGAELGERSEDRSTHRNGYRHRRWDTRAGTIDVAVPKLRQGSYLPSFLEPRKRHEQALVAVVQEAYVNGVSTRKVDRVVEHMGLQGVSKDQVSRMCAGLDLQVENFRNRPLEGRYPYVWLDAKIERVRDGGSVRHKALVVAYGVNEQGIREVIGLDVGEAETEAFWTEFLHSLRARGLNGVQLVMSDAHQGLKNAIGRVVAARWQRCCVHFARDMTGHVGAAQRQLVTAAIRQIFTADPARPRGSSSARSCSSSRPRPRRSRGCWKALRKTSSASTTSRSNTGRSCGRPTRWSASIARSVVVPMSSGSTPTTPR